MSTPVGLPGDSLPLSLEQGMDTVCQRFEQALQAGQRPAIETYLAEVPVEARAALLRELLALEVVYRRQAGETLNLAEYRRRFGDHSRIVEQVLAAATNAPAPAASRYRPVRPHARGGLGEVQVAVDEELHREVAFKRIQERFAHDPEVRRRFLREAEVTGRLEHPGIVPVYGLVSDAGGQPCYAMRFVQGPTLQEAIRRYHAAGAAEQRLALRELLGRFVAVCNTVAYAHSKRVIHRDLKPANVMLGEYGETLVVDWGLAKRLDPGDVELAVGEEARTAAIDQGETEVGTRPGAVAGTPAYMSPEQAGGEWARVGLACDVYSLGATLYEILVNRPPVVGANVVEVIEKARRGEWERPRQVRADVPRELEAVCRKAMAREPAERYATARDLGADVERWLADEPVSAYPEPWAARGRRWMRRHRQLVSGATAATVVLAISLGIGAALMGAANAQLRQKAIDLGEEQARTQSALEAEAKRRKVAREALDAQTSFVLGELLSRQPVFSEAHTLFLRQSLEAYERFAADTGQDEESRAGVAQAYQRVGSILQVLGVRAEAEAAYVRAAELYERLLADFPDSSRYSHLLATTHRMRGDLHCEYQEWNAGKEAYATGIALLQRLVKDRPDVLEHRYDLAVSSRNLGSVMFGLRDRKAARIAFEQSTEVMSRLAEDAPDVAKYREELVHSLLRFGSTLDLLGEPEAARKSFDRADKLLKQLTKENPANPEYRLLRADLSNDLGASLMRRGKRNESKVALEECIAIMEELMQDFPAVPVVRESLGGSYVNLANVLRDLDRPAESLDWCAKAIAVLKPGQTKDPQRFLARQCLRNGHSSRARSLNQLARYAEAAKDWARAIELNDEPHRAAEFRWERALSLARAGDHAQAVALADELAAAKGASAATLYACARVSSLASAVAKDDLPSQEKYVRGSVELLRKAVAAGFKDVARLKKDPDFTPIRAQVGFQQLLRDLEAKGKP